LIATDIMSTVLKSVVEHTLESVHVTFTRILLRNENGIYICRAAHSVFGMDYDLMLGKVESSAIYRYYEMALESREPLILERDHIALTPEERKSLFLEYIHSLCLCPLRIGDEPIGILVLGERRHASRESFDADKLRLASAIADQASGAIRRVRLYEQLEESFVQTILALANAIDAKDNYTSDHGERLSRLATLTASRMNCSPQEIQAVNWGMRLHDIGKIGVPDEILQKPGSLTDDEWQQMRKHPEIGASIIAPVKNLSSVTEIILHHHERFDGFGYPHKLSGEKIPLGARIIAVVDAYGAMTDRRIYRKARSHTEAMAEIARCTGSQFDPGVTAAFTAVVEEQQKSHNILRQTYIGKERVAACD
jgi:HD-GYP domain-containing protein (c-di-GMP phosphodiesterase class II)